MKTANLSQLSEQALKLLIKDCELKIKCCEADLDDYELYVKCQRNLLERRLHEPLSTSTLMMVM
jgi:hypothetical protein